MTQPGAGWTERSTASGDLTADRVAAAAGPYSATATATSGSWVMQLVAFKPDSGTADTTPPTVSVTAPAAGATVSGDVTVTATAADNVAVAGVSFFVDGQAVGAEDTSVPYSVTWPTTSGTNGSHSLTARARDAAGNQATSTAVAVTVSNQAPPDTTPPTVSVTAPAAGATVSGDVTVTATAADNVAVAGVSFFVDGQAVGAEDTSVPYSVTWPTTSGTNGSHSLTARARDAAGNQATSTAVAVTVSNQAPPDTTPPTVSVTAPAAGATVSGDVTVTATAADNVAVAGVSFFVDGQAVGAEDTSVPYSVTWPTTSGTNGSHSLTARARDAAGNQATSTAVAVTVSNRRRRGGSWPATRSTKGPGRPPPTRQAAASPARSPTARPGERASTAGAVVLDGNDDVVDLGNPTALRITGSLTISAWINSGPFPIDDAAIVSKRGAIGFQFDTTIDTGPRTIGLKLTSGQGAEMARYGATTLQPATWYHVAGVYDATARTMTVYLNGQVDNGTLQGTVTSSQQDSPTGVLIGQRFDSLSAFGGRIDDVRIYSKALTTAEVQTDMATGVLGGGPGDTTPPTVSVTAPAAGAHRKRHRQRHRNRRATTRASRACSFLVDGAATGVEDTAAPYALAWDTRASANGAHTLTARARDAAGNTTLSAGVTRDRRELDGLPERNPRDRPATADGHRLPARRADARRRAFRSGRRSRAPIHDGFADAVP